MGFLTRAQFLLGLALAAAACGPATQSPRLAAAPGESLEFEGSWNAAGRRHSISLGEGRLGSIVNLKGTMLLAGPGRPGVGFQSEVIGLVDSATGFQGRSVWTDERGDQVYSELQGEGTAAKTANRCQAGAVSPAGTGKNQMPSASANGTARLMRSPVVIEVSLPLRGRAERDP